MSAGPEIDTLIRWTYFDEMQRGLDSLDKTLIVPFDSIIKVVTVSLRNDDPFVMQDNDICVEVVLDSNFPREVICQKVMLSLELLENKGGYRINIYYNVYFITSFFCGTRSQQEQREVLQGASVKWQRHETT